MKLNDFAPVLISIGIILLIAFMQKHSLTIAGITATMPVTIPLSLWIVYSSAKGDQVSVENYTRGMVTGIISTLVFTLALWLGARAGLKLGWMVTVAYAAWLATVIVTQLIRRGLGI
jgi:hypothetical protein